MNLIICCVFFFIFVHETSVSARNVMDICEKFVEMCTWRKEVWNKHIPEIYVFYLYYYTVLSAFI